MVSFREGYCPYQNELCSEVHSQNAAASSLFFAYASEPPRRGEAIQGAIERLRQEESFGIRVSDWTELEIEGNIIFCTICEGIRNTGCLVADISGLNFNVLFEVGFAIGCGVPIWPILEESVSDTHSYASFRTLTTIGYSRYKNSKSIFGKLLKKKPWARKSHLPVPELISGQPTRSVKKILYLKSVQENEPSLRITETVQQQRVEVTIDDPLEIQFQPLSWYLDRLTNSYAVLIDLGNPDADDSRLHMAKCALVAGIAVASGRKLLMVGENINVLPIDYHDLVSVYKSAAQATTLVTQFLSSVTSEILSLTHVMRSDITQTSTSEEPLIKKIDLGDNIAENELIALNDYFVETPQFQDTLQSEYKLLVGRKGTGKSALAHMIVERKGRDLRNVVHVINPKGYELGQIVELVQRSSTPIRGKFLESLWKYIISTEALNAIDKRLTGKSLDESWSEAEYAILEYLRENPDIQNLSMASRLIRVLELSNMIPSPSELVPEAAIISRLHQNELNRLRDLICTYLTSNDRNLTILVDGLVSQWDTPEERQYLPEVFLALTSAIQDLRREWSYRLNRDGDRGGVSFCVFLRSDIFKFLLDRSAEPDKLQYEQVYWDDADTLLEVVTRRIETSVAEYVSGVLNWSDILEPGFSPDEMATFLARSLLFRPRDVIYYFQRVLFHANRRRNPHLTLRDFNDALREYSEYALQALSAEWHPYVDDMAALLLSFYGGPAEFSFEALRQTILSSDIHEESLEEVLRFLIQSQFLGIAIDEHNYRYATTPTQTTIMERQAGRFVHQQGGVRKFRVHRAFHESLALTERARRTRSLVRT